MLSGFIRVGVLTEVKQGLGRGFQESCPRVVE